MTEENEEIVNRLKKGHRVVIKNMHGHSMEPLLYEGRSQVIVEPIVEKPGRGDLVLWWRKDGSFILHRVVGEDERAYLLRGDHNVKEERANKRRVVGVVTDICREGKWFPVTNRRYQAYVRRRMALAEVRSLNRRIYKAGTKKQ
ncbi:MAG: S24/S26 family peptidase [Oscillospiraceae bacterium]|nr:S24/S26 family peptidase [Oscillospiraceae bacterium]